MSLFSVHMTLHSSRMAQTLRAKLSAITTRNLGHIFSILLFENSKIHTHTHPYFIRIQCIMKNIETGALNLNPSKFSNGQSTSNTPLTI